MAVARSSYALLFASKRCLASRHALRISASRMSSDKSGSGRDGAIREAGGAFGKREAAQEEQFFRKLQAEQFSKMKERLEDEIEHHEEEIDRHRKAIKKILAKKADLDKH
ncbi:unnamed protein product [Notodromas monacha]|uniref:ATPase inhibitor, mitochondrial n=1 Tax=Notodromas monacha TaxID=399045 RepID=A0A7R9BCP5_9CRUS|nr:unnamed protein product [Notodromas monacha]CAD7285328.1 unnamed protein product [Notodromas monacha]CAG0912872.1 unnamed protein product [Notodromas monacha]CAG0925480.1 unnamed protein product [Notodromas monacha]